MSAAAALLAVSGPAPRRAGDECPAAVLPALFVPVGRQWLSTTAGRVAPEGYSWMQAVHWVAGSGLYEPRRHRSHGPRSFGPMTVFVAQLLTELSPCRPGIAYLMRRTGLSERAVEYHLAMLREAGLLAYICRGTRVRGERAQASEFARVIPPEFDQALGIRTAGEGAERRMTGIAEAGRELMARLAKKAARRVRRPQSTAASKPGSRGVRRGARGESGTTVSDGSRCTPMGGGAGGSSAAGVTSSPPESKLASGVSKSPTPKKSKSKASGRRRLNRVGRRHQLARELTQELDWLRGCAVPRIAWVARHVADAGWTVTEVQGWLHLRGETTRVRRGSGLLAVLLANAETVLDTPAKRADAVERWRGAQQAARCDRVEQVRARHERFEGDWQRPADPAVLQKVESAFTAVRTAVHAPIQQSADHGTEYLLPLEGVEDMDAELLAECRSEARAQLMGGDTSLIEQAVLSMGQQAAQQLYGADLVRRAHQLAGCARSSLVAVSW
ncbi:helix-turn-helix domain-containing protein [Streptomyces diacarni]|uniref:helix-turn-helix domain-containing protein n=1 Tax=Streptomyces diacarni TaxID=2800381 RepID=UPI0033D4BEDA